MPTPKTSLRVSVAAIAAAMLAPASSLLAGECDVVDFLDQFNAKGGESEGKIFGGMMNVWTPLVQKAKA